MGDIIGGIASIGGAIIGADAAKDSAEAAAQAQLQATRENNKLAREFRGENTANLGTFMQRGDVAGAYINALLGLPDAYYIERTPNGQPQRIGGQQQQPNALAMGGAMGGDFQFPGIPNPNQQQGDGGMKRTKVTRVSANDAFRTYRNSNGYNFRLNQGYNALNNGLASAGLLRSGKAMKEALRYGQDYASNEFGNYLGYLGGQQATGLSAASGIAGVGSTALNAMSQNNQSGADARSGAALASGLASQNMWSGIGQGVGNLFSSSFGGGGGGGLSPTVYTPSGINNLVNSNLASWG